MFFCLAIGGAGGGAGGGAVDFAKGEGTLEFDEDDMLMEGGGWWEGEEAALEGAIINADIKVLCGWTFLKIGPCLDHGSSWHARVLFFVSSMR